MNRAPATAVAIALAVVAVACGEQKPSTGSPEPGAADAAHMAEMERRLEGVTGNSTGRDLRPVADLFHRYLTALTEGDWESVCSFVSSEAAARLGRAAVQTGVSRTADCPSALAAADIEQTVADFRNVAAHFRFDHVRVTGPGEMVVRYSVPGLPLARLLFRREESGWKLANVVGAQASGGPGG